jgi:uncharacterized damage-inducible protein DinB
MNSRELQQLLDYHYWARDRLLDAAERLSPDDWMRDLGSSFASVRDTLVHIYAAEWIWCSRWRGDSPTAMPRGDAFSDVATLRRAWSELEATLRTVLDQFAHEGLDRVVEYRDTKGTAWRQVFWQMLQHVVNHASYHRGQVTTMMRQLRASPPASTDLITFYREQRS